MFAKLSILVLAVSGALAATIQPRGGAAAPSCSSGPVQCCNTVQDPDSANYAATKQTLGLLDAAIQGLGVPIGVGCTPISVIGVGPGSSCSGESVCCEDTTYSGTIGLGCVPVGL
ncbi:fungal hydrophobin-domain-containing protein, partial [Pterulicium gracile]